MVASTGGRMKECYFSYFHLCGKSTPTLGKLPNIHEPLVPRQTKESPTGLKNLSSLIIHNGCGE